VIASYLEFYKKADIINSVSKSGKVLGKELSEIDKEI